MKRVSRWVGGPWLGHMVTTVVALAVLVGPVPAQETSQESRNIVIQKKQKQKQQQGATQEVEVQVEQVDGQIVIITGDGEKHVIDLATLQSQGKAQRQGNIMVEVQSENDNDEKRTRSRAILVGPQGNQEVIFDSDAEGLLAFRFDELPSGTNLWRSLNDPDARDRIQFTLQPTDFMIGIHCDLIDETLKLHLDLEQGLVVKEVYEDSAAEQAGLQVHDILVQANGEELQTLEDLIDRIQEAGKQEASMSLQVLRKGKQLDVEVKPSKRDTELPAGAVMDLSGVQNLWTEQAQIQRALPGWIQGEGQAGTDKLAAEIAELREMIKELRKEIGDK